MNRVTPYGAATRDTARQAKQASGIHPPFILFNYGVYGTGMHNSGIIRQDFCLDRLAVLHGWKKTRESRLSCCAWIDSLKLPSRPLVQPLFDEDRVYQSAIMAEFFGVFAIPLYVRLPIDTFFF